MEDNMQKLIKAFENIMVAVTFAESGEYDEARKVTAREHEKEAASVPAGSILKTATKS